MTAPAPTGQELRGAERPPVADLVAGLLSVVLGVAVLLYVRTFPQLPDNKPGPALFPAIVAAMFVLFGAILVIRAARAWRHPRPVEEAVGTSTASGRLNALAVVGFVVLYLLLVDVLGFVITMASLMSLLMWRLGTRPLVAVAAAAATTGLIVLLFQRVLLVPLPAGLLG